MSANLVVDLSSTTDYRNSIMLGSGASFTVGEIVDLLHADTYTNVFVNATAGSGAIEIRVQSSDSTASGTFTDPTSGLPLTGTTTLATNFLSGGLFFANSGLWVSGSQSVSAPVNNAPMFCSGGMYFAGLQVPNRYARLINNSGVFPSWYNAGFIRQKKTVGSGGGFTLAPGSGSVNV